MKHNYEEAIERIKSFLFVGIAPLCIWMTILNAFPEKVQDVVKAGFWGRLPYVALLPLMFLIADYLNQKRVNHKMSFKEWISMYRTSDERKYAVIAAVCVVLYLAYMIPNTNSKLEIIEQSKEKLNQMIKVWFIFTVIVVLLKIISTVKHESCEKDDETKEHYIDSSRDKQ